MKIRFTKIILCSVLLLIASGLKAQNHDYVITLSGDTINCKILFDGRYKVEGSATSKRMSLDEIKEFYTVKDDKLSRAIYLPGHKRPQFMAVVEKGKIDLYGETKHYVYMSPGPGGMMYDGMTYDNTITEWYIAKGTDTVKVLKNSDFLLGSVFLKSKKSRKNDLAEILKDNKEIYDKFINDDKFSFDQIRNLVHLYNTGQPFDPNAIKVGSVATKDYVIKKNQDTIFCEIEPGTFNTMSRYRVHTEDKFTKIDTTIKEYYLSKNASTYVLETLPKDKKHREYVKLLIRGKINLFSYSLNNSADDSAASLYACKGPSDLVQIKHTFSSPGKYEKKAFTDLISDDSSLVEKVKNISYDFTSIFNYIKMYNSHALNNNKPTE